MARIAFSINGVPVRLTEQRWRHIRERHPEIEQPQWVLEAIASPDLVRRGDFGALLGILKLDNLYVVAVYREVTSTDGFVITAYLAERLRGREIIWSR